MATRFIDSSFGIQGGLASGQIPLTIQDSLTTDAEAWSLGSRTVLNVAAQAPLGQVWSFLGWSIVFTPFLMNDGAGPFSNTQLGKIIGGLTFDKATAQEPPAAPWQAPIGNLPSNTFGMSSIWDGSDPSIQPLAELPAPPMYSDPSAPGLLPIIFNYSLPVPAQIYPGEQMQMGLWITPSLVEGQALSVTAARYTIVVDDGQPQVTTWGRDLATELAH